MASQLKSTVPGAILSNFLAWQESTFFNLVPSLQVKEKINTGGTNSVFHT